MIWYYQKIRLTMTLSWYTILPKIYHIKVIIILPDSPSTVYDGTTSPIFSLSILPIEWRQVKLEWCKSKVSQSYYYPILSSYTIVPNNKTTPDMKLHHDISRLLADLFSENILKLKICQQRSMGFSISIFWAYTITQTICENIS